MYCLQRNLKARDNVSKGSLFRWRDSVVPVTSRTATVVVVVQTAPRLIERYPLQHLLHDRGELQSNKNHRVRCIFPCTVHSGVSNTNPNTSATHCLGTSSGFSCIDQNNDNLKYFVKTMTRLKRGVLHSPGPYRYPEHPAARVRQLLPPFSPCSFD